MPMTLNNKEKVHKLLKGIETGDPESVTVVNEAKYIQHNPLTREGSEGLAELFKRLSKMSPKVELVRVFQDGDYVFAHTDYDFNVVEICFEVFRFEEGLAVEHWDNLQDKHPTPNLSGHTMIDGTVEARDLDKTEVNRELVRSFVTEVLINGHMDKLNDFVSDKEYTEHNPTMADGLDALQSALSKSSSEGKKIIQYKTIHRILAEGSFVLCMSEGYYNDVHTSFNDLFRVVESKIVEHWDTRDAVAPKTEWKNNNGKF